MGLAERRAAKQFETNRLPQLKKEIDAAAGFAVPVEVNWEQLSLEGQADSYDESWTAIYFTPLIAALKAITIDEMGKDALKAGLKKVVVKNGSGIYYGDRMSTFEAGVLTLDHEPNTNVGDVQDRTDGIRKALEAKL